MSTKEISITGHGLATMCRLCLSRGIKVIDVFTFSTRFKDKIADVIMKCAPVQIMRYDEMPNNICKLCYTQLEKVHKFQMQIMQSDKKLRRYLQKLHASDKQPVHERSFQSPSEDSLIDNTDADVKAIFLCESLEHHDVLDLKVNWREKECENFNSASKINDKMPLKSKIKIEKIEDNSIIPTGCADDTVETFFKGGEASNINISDSELTDDMNADWKVDESANCNPACIINEEIALNYEIKDEPMDDKSLILIESVVNTVDASSNDGVSEFSWEDTKAGISHTSGNSAWDRSVDVEKCAAKKSSINFTQSSHLNTYKRRHTGEKSYHCKICNKSFVTSRGLKNHMRTHTGDKPHQCEICNKDFTHYSNFINHKCIHTGEKPYQCDVCKKCFRYLSHLNTHKLTHTGEKPYQCDVCNKCFIQLCSLKMHKRIHTGERPYQCDVCNKCFIQSCSLKIHKRIHTGEKAYQCEVCSKCFVQSKDLTIHMRLHTGEKPYKCDVCNKCFIQSNCLKIHKRIHTGERPYQCDVCEKSFRQLSQFKTHKLRHSGEKPYQCNICKNGFVVSGALKKHMRLHTREKPYMCDICLKCFSQFSNLKRHKRSHTEKKQK